MVSVDRIIFPLLIHSCAGKMLQSSVTIKTVLNDFAVIVVVATDDYVVALLFEQHFLMLGFSFVWFISDFRFCFPSGHTTTSAQ